MNGEQSHPFSILGDRRATLYGIAVLGARLCGYSSGDPEQWITGRCDCKYLGERGVASFAQTGHETSEQTGCCELRDAYRALNYVGVGQWGEMEERAYVEWTRSVQGTEAGR